MFNIELTSPSGSLLASPEHNGARYAKIKSFFRKGGVSTLGLSRMLPPAV